MYISGINALVKNLSERKYHDVLQKLEKAKKYSWNIELITKIKKNKQAAITIDKTKINNDFLAFSIIISPRTTLNKLCFSFLIYSSGE